MSGFIRFGAFRNAVMSGWNEYREAWVKGWYLLASLYTATLTVGVILVVGAFSAAILGTISLVKVGSSLLPQKTVPLEIMYRPSEINKKNAEGLYHSVFDIQVHTPIGKTADTFTLYNSIVGEAGCLVSELGNVSEARGGLASSTAFYGVSCTSRFPIIDTGRLFTIRNENRK